MQHLSRRSFVGSALATTVAAGAAVPAQAAFGFRMLKMRNAHTNERFEAVYHDGFAPIPAAMRVFAHFARDWRTGDVIDFDVQTMDILFAMQREIGFERDLILLSGFRTPQTNRSLRGAATDSWHMRGRAADITHPGVSVSNMATIARSLRAGGVGIYSASNFVHVDSARVRTWGA